MRYALRIIPTSIMAGCVGFTLSFLIGVTMARADDLKLEVPMTPENQEIVIPQMCDGLVKWNMEKWGSLCQNLVPALVARKAAREAVDAKIRTDEADKHKADKD
jgi:hypothetical protein